MAIKRSPIPYCDFSGADLNFVLGCTPISTECENCYARNLIERFGGDPDRVIWYMDKLERLETARFEPKGKPFRRGSGSKPIAFVCDMADFLHPDVPRLLQWRAAHIFGERKDVDWLVLTKREIPLLLPRNVWLGVTVGHPESLWRLAMLASEDQYNVRWVSVEPMLAPLDLRPWLPWLSWVACGGESGKNRRPFDIAWARDLRDQCQEFNVPFFFKQASGLKPGTDPFIDGEMWRQFPRSAA